MKINMESLNPIFIIFHTRVQGDFLTINLWKSRLYFKKCIVFLALFKEKSWKKERQKVPQESDGGRKKGFWGSINSVFWQIMSYSFWWICNLPLPMSCCDHSLSISTVKPKLLFNFCTFDSFPTSLHCFMIWLEIL